MIDRWSLWNRVHLSRLALMVVMLFSFSAQAQISCPSDFSGMGRGFFYAPTTNNQCRLGLGDGFSVAMNNPQWGGGVHCGECLELTGPLGSTIVRVIDLCPECVEGELNISVQAFAAIADPMPGFANISWERVDCPVSGAINYEFNAGSSPFFFQVKADNHRYGITDMEVLIDGEFEPLARINSSFFQYPGSDPVNSVTLRLRATTNQWIEAVLGSPSQSGPIAGQSQFSSCIDPVYEDRFE
ncbi:MAG: expansin EXLX1 family cellulose-binding protein [Pseudomonadota bacterium]